MFKCQYYNFKLELNKGFWYFFIHKLISYITIQKQLVMKCCFIHLYKIVLLVKKSPPPHSCLAQIDRNAE